MPAILKIGLSKKVSENYNSDGYSIDLQTELPHAAVDRPEELARTTEYLFQLAEDLLQQQVVKRQGEVPRREVPGPVASRPSPSGGGPATERRTYPGTQEDRRNEGRARPAPSNGQGRVRLATGAQLMAIEKMAKRAKTDPHQLCADDFGVALRELTLAQASELIDALKGMIEAKEGQGAGR
jgi:hypothetical protein